MTKTLAIINIAFLTTVISCNQSDNTTGRIIDYKDTLYQSKTYLVKKDDSSTVRDKIYFLPTDLTVNTSRFFYTAYKPPYDRAKSYKIYFDKEKVISFCDSALKALPTAESDINDKYFYDRLDYNNIKEQAIKNKMNETVSADELWILLDRFHPLIVNDVTNDKPVYIILTNQSSENGGEYLFYDFTTNQGDTIHLTAKTIRPQAINLEQ